MDILNLVLAFVGLAGVALFASVMALVPAPTLLPEKVEFYKLHISPPVVVKAKMRERPINRAVRLVRAMEREERAEARRQKDTAVVSFEVEVKEDSCAHGMSVDLLTMVNDLGLGSFYSCTSAFEKIECGPRKPEVVISQMQGLLLAEYERLVDESIAIIGQVPVVEVPLATQAQAQLEELASLMAANLMLLASVADTVPLASKVNNVVETNVFANVVKTGKGKKSRGKKRAINEMVA